MTSFEKNFLEKTLFYRTNIILRNIYKSHKNYKTKQTCNKKKKKTVRNAHKLNWNYYFIDSKLEPKSESYPAKSLLI